MVNSSNPMELGGAIQTNAGKTSEIALKDYPNSIYSSGT
jgi:hypothetical protein